MKIKNIVTVFLIAFISASCAPAAKIVPTETAIPTSTFTPVPPIPTITPTLIPTIDIDGQSIPDPHFSNPELFDLQNLDSPIPQFINSMKMAEIDIDLQQVADSIFFESKISTEGKSYIIGYYDFDPKPVETGETLEGNVPLFFAMQSQNGQWIWEKASPGILARLSGYKIGSVTVSDNIGDPHYDSLIGDFSNIIGVNWVQFLKAGMTVEKAIDLIKSAQTKGQPEIDPNNIFDFIEYDKQVRFATKHNMSVQFQSLFANWVFSSQVIQDVNSGKISKDDFEIFLLYYTQSFVERYDGHIDSQLKVNGWVVGNEVASCWMWCDSQTRQFMSSLIDDGILARMFTTAKQANPNAELILAEDHLLENEEIDIRAKFVRLVDILQKQGAPIDSVAVQNHLWLGRPLLSSLDMENYFQQLEQRKLSVNYNEVTISQSQKNQYTNESVSSAFSNPYLQQAKYLQTILAPMKSRKGATVIFFCISDVPGPFDTYNLNDLTAKGVMFDAGNSVTFTNDTEPMPRPMYYVLLQFLTGE